MVRSIPKYTDQYDHESKYAAELRDRSKVNTALWNYNAKKKIKCDICQQTLRTPAGQTYLQCQSCGKIFNPEEPKQDKKTLTDPNAKTTGIIISQPKKKRRASPLDEENGLDDETLDDLRQFGIYPTSWKDYFPT